MLRSVVKDAAAQSLSWTGLDAVARASLRRNVPDVVAYHGVVERLGDHDGFATRGILPDEVIDRPKQGFAVPLANWFRGELEGFARDLLLSRRSRERNILNAAYVEKLLDLHGSGRPLDFQLWTLISFELWCRTFLDKRTPLGISAPAEIHSAVAVGGLA